MMGLDVGWAPTELVGWLVGWLVIVLTEGKTKRTILQKGPSFCLVNGENGEKQYFLPAFFWFKVPLIDLKLLGESKWSSFCGFL